MVTSAMKLKDTSSLEGNLWQTFSAYYKAETSLWTQLCIVKTTFFSSSHVQLWELDCKETWAWRNWCFRIVVLLGLPWWHRGESICLQCGRPGFDPWVGQIAWRQKWQPTPVFLPGEPMDGGVWWTTTERLHFLFFLSLDIREIKVVSPKGNQPKLFIWKTDAEVPNTLAAWCEQLTRWKRLWCWKRPREGREGDNRGWDGWMASLTQLTWIWTTLGDSDGQGGLACYSPWGCKELDMS